MASQACAIDRWTAWDRFLETTPRRVSCSHPLGRISGRRPDLNTSEFVLRHQDAIAGGAIVQKCSCPPESCFYYIQDGPLLPADPAMAGDIFEAILEEIDGRRKLETEIVSHLRIEPRWQHLPDFVSAFRTPPVEDSFMEPRNTLLIDLRPRLNPSLPK